jgi:hypothetical protein|tara:strand:+ start:255 stop:1151 length:897 start_codon:yes stop_codon:yes gene_type:complete
MEKEKVVVAMSNEPGDLSVCQNLGAEISIGRIPLEKQTELKQALQSGSFFTERTYKGKTYMGSDFLNDLMDINDIYHKNGILFYEEEMMDTKDPESLSTDNWASKGSEGEWLKDGEMSLDTYSYYGTPGISTLNKVEIPKEGVVVLNLRLEDGYFVANGEFNIDDKIDFWDNSLKAKRKKFPVGLHFDFVDWNEYKVSNNGFWFELLHSASINGELLTRDEVQEEMAGGSNIYYTSHFIFKDGEFIGWLTSNNREKSFPFHEEDGLPQSISPNLTKSEFDSSDWAWDVSPVKNLLDKL